MNTTIPPVPNRPRSKDADHVKLIWIFHLVFAGMALLGIVMMFFQLSMMHQMFENPDFWKNSAFPNQQAPPPPPKEFFMFFKWMLVVMGGLNIIFGVLNAISGFCIRARMGRTYSLVIAGLDCVLLPLGTVLGIFTFVVLSRPSVREMYEQQAAHPGEAQ